MRPEDTGLRVRTIKPRRRRYNHRGIIAIVDGIGVTEYGEVISDLPSFALREDSHIWVTYDTANLLNILLEVFRDALSYTFTYSEDPNVPQFIRSRLSDFGFARDTLFSLTRGKKANHRVWDPSRMFSTPTMAIRIVDNTHSELIKFAVDVRDWCKEHDLPIASTLPGIASSLSRDKRFWPEDRGRVPRATNERVRQYLPGVYQERRAPLLKTFPTAIALDQSRAYHRAAQEVSTPNPTNLYARGFFHDPENAPRMWAKKGGWLYSKIIKQPGLVALIATSRPRKKGEWRPPVCEERSRTLRYVWTNELPFLEEHGLKVEGLIAAWTSEDSDSGLPLYGKWAEEQIDLADDYRRQWLKPTLHSLYGLLGSRQRNIAIGRSHGAGKPALYTIRGFGYKANEIRINGIATPVTNVATLGVLQSTIRERSMILANVYGQDCLHIHADGIHVRATQMEFIPKGWTADELTNLSYMDDVSFVSDQKIVLPGRHGENRNRIINEHNKRTRRIHIPRGQGSDSQCKEKKAS